MNGKSTLVRYTAPGLPNSPKLWFDRERKSARVNVRVDSWRSWVRAHRATRVVRWLINFYIGWLVWHKLDFIDSPFGRGFWIMIVVAMFSAAAKAWMHFALDGFFARQLFGETTRFWFNSQAVAFKSKLYANGVVIWREWKDRLVHVTFRVERDQYADNQLPARDFSQEETKRRRMTASIIRLTIEMRHHDHLPTVTDDPNAMREIPVIELDQEDVAEVAMVLMTAAALTQRSPEQRNQLPPGIDIDTASPY
ncbi:hypothetical protein [Thalassoglobus sp.]|uniref:hypothetical protein n=1 Tax=Thalassoglobus sp. TaxID=2795869 RepID=UPI003AA8C233